MTDKELKDLVASLALDRKEERKALAAYRKELAAERKELATERRKEAAEREKEREKERKELAALQNKTERSMEDLIKTVKDVTKRMDDFGLSDNAGHHAEQFFQSAFREKLEFGHVKYNEMIGNLSYKDGKDEIEFDVVLLNGNSIALIEVKNRIHPSFVNDFAENRIKKFRKYFPRFKNYAAYLGIAGFSFSDEVVARASAYGIGIIGQKGDSVEVKGKLNAYV